MKKKIVSVLMAAAVAAALAGCSSELSNEYVTVKQYKGLEVPQAETSDVTDEYVESIIESNLDASAEQVDITDRASQEGDWANIDYTGYIDDVAFDGGSATGVDLQIGQGGFIGAYGDYQGFEEQLIGHKPGEEFDITVQFADDYNDQVGGKVARFHIVMNSLYERKVPELTDEWVQANSAGAENVDEYREEIREQEEEYNENMAESDLMSSMQEALLGQIEVKAYPDGAVEEQVQIATDYYTTIAGYYGMELQDFVEGYFQMTMDDFNTELQSAAERTVQLDEAVKLIAEKEKLTPSEEEYDEKIAEYAEQSGADDVDAFIEQNGEDTLRTSVLRETVLQYLVDNCVQVEDSESEQTSTGTVAE